MTDNKVANIIAKEIVDSSPNKMMRDLAEEMGVPLADVQRYVAQQAYRRTYNSRPEVQAKRKLYNKERAEKMKTIRERIQQSDKLTTLNRLAEEMVK